jgi:GntR family transcriptional regulator
MGKAVGIRPLDAAKEKIEAYLMINRLAPHAKLPSEREMSLMWKMNRMTLRSAIQRLVAEGKLYRRQGSGTYVAQAKIVRNLQDSRSMTEWLDESGAGLASKVVSLRRLRASQRMMDCLQLESGQEAWELIRVRMVKGQPMMLERAYLSRHHFPNLDQFDFEQESLYEVMEEAYGVRIAGGRESVALTYAGPEEASHLDLAENTALFMIDGLAWDQENKPVEFFQSWLRADHIQLFSVLKG